MTSTEGRAAAFRNTIEHFLKERLDAKLDKLQADDPKRADLIAQHRRETWLLEMPLMPMACTRSSTERVEMPCT